MDSNFFIFLALIVIGFFVFKIYRHFYPATPPAAAGANTPPPVPVNWNERIGNFLKVVAAIAIIWLLFSGGFNSIFKGGSNSETTQSVDVRDNYGVIQQNDVHVTNNQVVVRTVEKVKTVKVDGDDVIVQSESKRPRLETIIRKKYTDPNEDPGSITVSYEKDAPISGTSLR